MLPHDETGEGPAIVLLHAGIADRTMWAELLPPIADAGYRAIALDLPGFGDAADPGLEPHTAVVATLDALGVERASLVGNSYGGAVALRVAVVAPDRVDALVLVSAPAPNLEPTGRLQEAWEAEEAALESGDVEAAVAAVVATWTLPDAPQALRDRVAAMQRRAFAVQLAAGDVQEEHDDPLEPDASALSTLDVPALVAVGEHDMPDFQLGAEALSRQLPRATVTVIPKAGHLAPLEEPEAFLRLALEHVASR